ncbi:hypothetical protein HPP92_027655, partial [Vanilla planifolia]
LSCSVKFGLMDVDPLSSLLNPWSFICRFNYSGSMPKKKKVFLYGGHITSWKNDLGEEVLFMICSYEFRLKLILEPSANLPKHQ